MTTRCNKDLDTELKKNCRNLQTRNKKKKVGRNSDDKLYTINLSVDEWGNHREIRHFRKYI